VAPKFVLATKSSILNRGTNAIYPQEDSKAMNGMQVKLTFSFTAGGNSFLVAVTVSGLTEKEMPPGEDFIHVEIPGMCIPRTPVRILPRTQAACLWAPMSISL